MDVISVIFYSPLDWQHFINIAIITQDRERKRERLRYRSRLSLRGAPTILPS